MEVNMVMEGKITGNGNDKYTQSAQVKIVDMM